MYAFLYSFSYTPYTPWINLWDHHRHTHHKISYTYSLTHINAAKPKVLLRQICHPFSQHFMGLNLIWQIGHSQWNCTFSYLSKGFWFHFFFFCSFFNIFSKFTLSMFCVVLLFFVVSFIFTCDWLTGLKFIELKRMK